MDSAITADGLMTQLPHATVWHTNSPVAAIDIGGTNIKAALFLDTCDPLHEFQAPTPRYLGPEAVVRAVIDTALRLIDAAQRLIDAAQRQYGIGPAALGVACLGLVEDRRGIATYSAAVGWRDLPLVDLLQSRLHIPVALRQDIRAAAYAETTTGGAKDPEPTLFVAIGTGIGGAVTADGHLQPGAHFRAGEIGHLQVRQQGGRVCRCGGSGCVETYSSAAAIAATASRALGRAVSAPEVVQAAAGGHGWAVQIWHEAIEVLAQGLTAAALIIDPSRIVIGGGLSMAGPALLDLLRRAVTGQYPFGDPPAIVLAKFGDTGAVRGAALSANDLLMNIAGAA